PDKRALIARYAARFPPGPHSPHMSVQAHGLGQAALVAEVTDEVLRRNGFDEEHIRMLRELGLHGAIAVPFRTEGGVDLAMMFISTARTYDYDNLKLAEEYVERVGAALHNARVYRLAQEALRARDDFLAMAAHELRTPLTSLRTSCERLSSLPRVQSDPDVNAVVDRIMRQARRLTRLVNRMLDASIDEQRLPLIVPERVDLVPLVREVVEEIGATRRDAQLELSLPQSVIGHWDGDRLRQVVVNLVENALKYGGDAPIRVALATDPARAQAVLTVSDRGIGIDPEVVPRLFEPYERGVSGRGYGGLGLGLFIARQIVHAHGGSIDVRSEPGAGSEFTVRLPLS
ncbi:MAG: sensor histidine kinase, partial [Polyangia bacterium]